MERRIDRILTNTDNLINQYYELNEQHVKTLAKKYVLNYIDQSKRYSIKDLTLICNVCYLLSLKFLVDQGPKVTDYCCIVSIETKKIVEKELDIAFSLKFNFNLIV